MHYRSAKPAHSVSAQAAASRMQPQHHLINGLQCLLLSSAIALAASSAKAEPMDVTSDAISQEPNAGFMIEDLSFHRLSDGTKPQAATQNNVDFLRERIEPSNRSELSKKSGDSQLTEFIHSKNQQSTLAPLPRYWHSFSRK